MKLLNRITSIVNIVLITSAVITRTIYITVFSSVVCLPVDILLNGASLLFFFATAITQKYSKIFTLRQEKLDAIKLHAQSKLDSVADIISQAMKDRDTPSIKFHMVIQEVK